MPPARERDCSATKRATSKRSFIHSRFYAISAWCFTPADTRFRLPASRGVSYRRLHSYTIIYSADDFRVTEELCVPRNLSGVLIRLGIEAQNPLRIDFRFTRDFQLMWPGSFGSSYGQWDAAKGVYRMGADGQTYAAVLGSPGAAPVDLDYATNYSSSTEATFTLGTVHGTAERTIAIAASLKSLDEALAAYRDLIARPAALVDETARFYRDYLAGTVGLRLPDRATRTGL